jgi:hypothetical protein
MEQKCSGCGYLVHAGKAGCQAAFNELLARDFSDYRYGRSHRLAVDAYSLQHPDSYCASLKSLLAHLGGLCCAFDHGAQPSAYRALQESLDGPLAFERPALPAFRGTLTIADALAATDPDTSRATVERWAGSVWDAHAILQGFVRHWVEQAARSGKR